MDATIIARTPSFFALLIEIPYNDSMCGGPLKLDHSGC
jgi:hypothetical protein